MNTLYTIVVGTEMDKFNSVLNKHDVGVKVNSVLKQIAEKFGGYSLTNMEGGYIMLQGEMVQEKSIKIEVVADFADHNTFKYIAKMFKDRLQQESVLLIMQPITGEFI